MDAFIKVLVKDGRGASVTRSVCVGVDDEAMCVRNGADPARPFIRVEMGDNDVWLDGLQNYYVPNPDDPGDRTQTVWSGNIQNLDDDDPLVITFQLTVGGPAPVTKRCCQNT
jgi:hypothetical protein